MLVDAQKIYDLVEGLDYIDQQKLIKKHQTYMDLLYELHDDADAVKTLKKLDFESLF
jgi:hypothetical protein